MAHLSDGLFFKPLLGFFSASVFQHIILLLTDSCGGLPQGVGPSQTLVASVGDDVILPCHLEPAADAVSKTLEWGRPDLEPRFVHVWYQRQDYLVNQNPSYKGRTSVSIKQLQQGDLSLKLSALKPSDNGIYRCYFPSEDKESTVELIVAAESTTSTSTIVSVSGLALSLVTIGGLGLGLFFIWKYGKSTIDMFSARIQDVVQLQGQSQKTQEELATFRTQYEEQVLKNKREELRLKEEELEKEMERVEGKIKSVERELERENENETGKIDQLLREKENLFSVKHKLVSRKEVLEERKRNTEKLQRQVEAEQVKTQTEQGKTQTEQGKTQTDVLINTGP